jgi:hypothetical protein
MDGGPPFAEHTPMAVVLERELATFRRMLPSLLSSPGGPGQYALVHGDQVVGLYPTFDAAADAGYDQFGLSPFLVKQVAAHEEPKYFSRNIAPCHSPKAS